MLKDSSSAVENKLLREISYQDRSGGCLIGKERKMYEELKEKLKALDEDISVEIDYLQNISGYGENQLFTDLCSISNAVKRTIGTIDIYFSEK